MIGFAFLIGFVVFFAFIIYRLARPKNSEYLRQIPGPPTYPIVGSFPTLVGKNPAEFTTWLLDSLVKYDSPTRFEIGPTFSVFLSKADQVETLLKSSTNITKSSNYDFIADWLGEGLVISTGAKWFKRRKQLTPAFHFQILKDFIPVFNEQAALLTSILGKQVKGNNPLNVCPYITNCTLDIICETAMGKQLGAQEHQSDYVTSVGRFAELAMNRFRNFLIWSNLIWHISSTGKESETHLKILHNFTKQVIHDRDIILTKARREAKVAGNDSTDSADPFKTKGRRMAFLDMLLDLKASGKMSEEEVREEVDTFMFGGHDTTATGLKWALYCIGSNPEVQEKLFEEISTLIGPDPEQHVTSEDLAKLKYMDCVLKESLRLFPSLPMIGRLTTEAFQCGKYTIPSDTIVNVSILGLHRNPEQFPDPLRFDPNRFLPENSEGRHPFAYVPFSAGPRNCIGQKFALQEEKVIMTHIIRKFKIKSTQRFEELAPAMELVLCPTDGIWLKLTARD